MPSAYAEHAAALETIDSGAEEADALVRLGRWLHAQGYQFTTVTPATHGRVNARPGAELSRTLRDVFGWSRPFAGAPVPPDMLAVMRLGNLLADGPGGLVRSKVRFSSIGGVLFAHSAYPTADADAVFFGPDTMRFAALISNELKQLPVPHGARVLDMGCGAGPGGIVAAQCAAPLQPQRVLADINSRALRFARANAELAGMADVLFAQGDLFSAVEGDFDFIVANPPYLNDSAQRTYRHGGGNRGGALSERIVREGLTRLAPGGGWCCTPVPPSCRAQTRCWTRCGCRWARTAGRGVTTNSIRMCSARNWPSPLMPTPNALPWWPLWCKGRIREIPGHR